MSEKQILKSEEIQSKIYGVRGIQVMLGEDLAFLYGIETKVLNQAVKRNIERFPNAFMFQINNEEFNALRSQLVTLEGGRGKHRKYYPYVFLSRALPCFQQYFIANSGQGQHSNHEHFCCYEAFYQK